MRRWRIVGAAGLAAGLMLTASLAPRAQEQAEIEDWKPDKLVNIQVLPKDMTPDALMETMRMYNASLNVDCVFCHKGQIGKPWSTYDFTDDTKARHETTRLMIKSTLELNEEFADLGEMDQPTKVTCATCHRRNRHPEIDPPEAAEKH
jgi:Photosynthetic reaction centre cytochrome C subunit